MEGISKNLNGLNLNCTLKLYLNSKSSVHHFKDLRSHEHFACDLSLKEENSSESEFWALMVTDYILKSDLLLYIL